MTNRSLKWILALLLLALMTSVLCAGTVFADGVSYVERSWNGSEVISTVKTAEVTPVPSNGNMTSGWYYLNSNVTKNGRVESITGDVNLILGDGCTLDVKGLYVPAGSTLTIYGQSEGTGKIYSHPSGGVAIGGYSGHDNGTRRRRPSASARPRWIMSTWCCIMLPRLTTKKKPSPPCMNTGTRRRNTQIPHKEDMDMKKPYEPAEIEIIL